MKITVDIKRILLTTIACLTAAIIPLTIPMAEDFYPFLVPLLFSVAVLLTSFDKIITKRKYQAFVLSALLTTLLFFISIMLGVLLGKSFLGDYAIFVICTLSGLLIFFIFSIVVKNDNLKLGLIVTGFLAFSTPYLTKLIREQKFLNIEFFGDPATFFIIWQTVLDLHYQ